MYKKRIFLFSLGCIALIAIVIIYMNLVSTGNVPENALPKLDKAYETSLVVDDIQPNKKQIGIYKAGDGVGLYLAEKNRFGQKHYQLKSKISNSGNSWKYIDIYDSNKVVTPVLYGYIKGKHSYISVKNPDTGINIQAHSIHYKEDTIWYMFLENPVSSTNTFYIEEIK